MARLNTRQTPKGDSSRLAVHHRDQLPADPNNATDSRDEIARGLDRITHALASQPVKALDSYGALWKDWMRPQDDHFVSAVEQHPTHAALEPALQQLFGDRYAARHRANKDLRSQITQIQADTFEWHHALSGLRLYALFGAAGMTVQFLRAFRALAALRRVQQDDPDQEPRYTSTGLSFAEAYALLCEARRLRQEGVGSVRGLSLHAEWQTRDCERAAAYAMQTRHMSRPTMAASTRPQAAVTSRAKQRAPRHSRAQHQDNDPRRDDQDTARLQPAGGNRSNGHPDNDQQRHDQGAVHAQRDCQDPRENERQGVQNDSHRSGSMSISAILHSPNSIEDGVVGEEQSANEGTAPATPSKHHSGNETESTETETPMRTPTRTTPREMGRCGDVTDLDDFSTFHDDAGFNLEVDSPGGADLRTFQPHNSAPATTTTTTTTTNTNTTTTPTPTPSAAETTTSTSEIPPSKLPPSETPPSKLPPSETPPSKLPPSETPPSETPPLEPPPSEPPPSETPPLEPPPSEPRTSEPPPLEPRTSEPPTPAKPQRRSHQRNISSTSLLGPSPCRSEDTTFRLATPRQARDPSAAPDTPLSLRNMQVLKRRREASPSPPSPLHVQGRGPTSQFKRARLVSHEEGSTEVQWTNVLTLARDFLAVFAPSVTVHKSSNLSQPSVVILRGTKPTVASSPAPCFVLLIAPNSDEGAWTVVFAQSADGNAASVVETFSSHDSLSPDAVPQVQAALQLVDDPAVRSALASVPPEDYFASSLPQHLDYVGAEEDDPDPRDLIKCIAVAVCLVVDIPPPKSIFCWAWLSALAHLSATSSHRLSDFEKALELPMMPHERVGQGAASQDITDDVIPNTNSTSSTPYIDAVSTAGLDFQAQVRIMQHQLKILSDYNNDLQLIGECTKSATARSSTAAPAATNLELDEKIRKWQGMLDGLSPDDGDRVVIETQLHKYQDQKRQASAGGSGTRTSEQQLLRELKWWANMCIGELATITGSALKRKNVVIEKMAKALVQAEKLVQQAKAT